MPKVLIKALFGLPVKALSMSLICFCLIGLVACQETDNEPAKSALVQSHSATELPLDSLKIRGDRALRALEKDSAVYYCEEVIKKIPQSQTQDMLLWQAKLANSYIRNRMFAKADTVLNQIENDWTKRDTVNVAYSHFLYTKGYSLLYKRNYSPAIQYFQRAYYLNQNKLENPDMSIVAQANKNLGYCYRVTGQIEKSLESCLLAEQVIPQLEPPDPITSSAILKDIGFIYKILGKNKLSNQYYNKALAELDYNLFKDNPYYYKIQTSLAGSYTLIFQYKKAATLFEGSDKFYREKKLVTSDHALHLEKYAHYFQRKGEFDRAIDLNKQGLDIFQQVDPKGFKTSKGRILHNMGNLYHHKEKYDRALGLYDESLPKVHPALKATVFHNIGRAYSELEQQDSALKYLRISKELCEGTKSVETYCYAVLQSIGDHYLKNEQLDKAEEVFRSLFERALKELDTGTIEAGLYAISLAEILSETGRQKEALEKCQFTLSLLTADSSMLQGQKNPSYEQLITDITLLQALLLKADIMHDLYLPAQDTARIALALEAADLAVHLTDSLRMEYTDNEAKLQSLDENFSLYETGISIAYDMASITSQDQYIHQALSFAQESKANLLHESLQTLEAQQLSNVPDSLTTLLSDLYKEFTARQQQLPDSQSLTTTTQKENFAVEAKEILTLKDDYYQLYKKIETDYPDYYQLKYKQPKANISELQQSLAKDSAQMISYFVGDSSIYLFCIGPDNFDLKKIPNDSSLYHLTDTLRRQLSEPNFVKQPEQAYRTFSRTAHSLYRLLIEPVAPMLKADRLIIIPDGPLSYIPFEVLLTEATATQGHSYKSLPYLCKKHSLNYSYSTSLYLKDQKRDPARTRAQVLAFAPNFEGRDSLPGKPSLAALKGTQEEVKAVQALTGGKSFLTHEATESQFKALADRYRVIHLATHALVDDQNPLYSKLAFAAYDEQDDSYLHTYELFDMQLNADLAVLSACNTGYGQMQRGEGVMSLARGFAYAGVPSIVMSLWPVQDRSTSQLMIQFYEGLRQGQSKDIALQNARLDYLDQTGELEAHPYFWAGFVMLGDHAAVDLAKGSNLLSMLLTGLILLLLGGAAFRMFRKREV